MSIWSRSHQDLARLAKDLQDRNNRTRTHAATRGNDGLQRQSSLSAIDTYRKHSPDAGESQSQGKKLIQRAKSVRFCLSDGNSPNGSFEENDDQNKSTTGSSISFENGYFQGRDDVFMDSSSENIVLGKDEENFKIKQISETTKENGSGLRNNSNKDFGNKNNHGGGNAGKKQTIASSDDSQLRLNGNELQIPLSECDKPLNSTHQKMRKLVSEDSEDGTPGLSRQEKGVSRQVLYLLQKDFISSSSGSSKPKLTLNELEGILATLSSSESMDGEDRHRNMIRMVETLICRQKAVIQKQEREMEEDSLKSKVREEVKEDPGGNGIASDHVKSPFADDCYQLGFQSRTDTVGVNVFSAAQNEEKHDDEGPCCIVNGDVDENGVHSSLSLKGSEAKEKKDIEKQNTGSLARSETGIYTSKSTSVKDIHHEDQKTDQVSPTFVDNKNHFVSAHDELSDEEIKEIIARGKKLLPMQNLEERDTLSLQASSSSSELNGSTGSGKEDHSFIDDQGLAKGSASNNSHSSSSNTQGGDGRSVDPLLMRNDTSSEGYSQEANSLEDIVEANTTQDAADDLAFQMNAESRQHGGQQLNSDACDLSLTTSKENGSVPVSKLDISNQTDDDESGILSEISRLSALLQNKPTKLSAEDGSSEILQRKNHFETHLKSEETFSNQNRQCTHHTTLDSDLTKSSTYEDGPKLKKDMNIDTSSEFCSHQSLVVGFDGCDVGCKVSTHKHEKKLTSPFYEDHITSTGTEAGGSSEDTVEHTWSHDNIPGYHGYQRHDRGSKNQCLCSDRERNQRRKQKLIKSEHQKDSTSLKDHECHRKVCNHEISSGRDVAGRISTRREIHSVNTETASEEEHIYSHTKKHLKGRTVKAFKQPSPKYYSDSDMTNESGCSQTCSRKFGRSQITGHSSSSPDTTSPCHCSSTSRKSCQKCTNSKISQRQPKFVGHSERQDQTVADDSNSSGGRTKDSLKSSDIELSTWSGSSCQCARCLAVSSHPSVSQSAGSFVTPQSGQKLNHALVLDNHDNGRRCHDSKIDTPVVTGSRKHKSHYKNGVRNGFRDFRIRNYSRNEPDDLTQYVVYRSDSSEVIETHHSIPSCGKLKEVPCSQDEEDKIQGRHPVDAQELKEILVDFHELFLCLCRDRQQEQQKREQQEEGGFDDISVTREEHTTNTTGPASERMESLDATYHQLDSEFDKVLADMKPHVLKLPQKSDRQKCAVWIKKLCEPPSAGVTGRKNRNMYSQLMLQMLKRGVLEGPFDKKPSDGSLPTLPPYMSIYFDEPMTGKDGQEGDMVPEWVNGELLESVGSSLFRKSTLGNPAATSTWLSGSSTGHDIRERPYSSLGVSLDRDPSLSPPRRSYLDRGEQGALGGSALTDMDWSKPYNSTTFGSSLPKGTTFQDDTSIGRGGEREVELRTKMIEAKYHEEKLRLQQKHDSAVQKILDRKNAEIEDVKNHYRGKAKDLEDVNAKLERKIQSLLKEMAMTRDSKDKQIADLKKLVEDTSDSRKSDYDKKLHEVTADFEQEKFEMQKQHTRNIQEILDDTNARLQRMEKEYTQQMSGNTNVIRELESRVQQLTMEAEQQCKLRSGLEHEKNDLEEKCEQVSSELGDLSDRYNQLERESQQQQEGHEHEMRTIKHKTEASLEFLKQEHTLAAGKASDAVKEMEHQVEAMRRKMKDSDDQCQRQIRDLETVHQQDKLHLENHHDKQIRSMKKELDQMEHESQKKIRHLEHLLQQKDIEICQWKEQNRDQALSAERALEEFKAEVEKNQTRMYEEMKQQMTQVESDLNKSKQTREKQNRELTRQLEQERAKFDRHMTEVKISFEHEKAQMLHDLHLQKEYILSEHEKAVDTLKEGHKVELRSLEARYRERQDKDNRNVTEFECQVRELREELVQSNQLRKQQLVELGLLREEEKQKMQRDHEAEKSRMRSEMEQQRLELQKSHSSEMEAMLEKTNQRLKDIEREYAERGQKSTEVVAEFQASTNQLREEIKRIREQSDHRIAELVNQQEEDKKTVKKQYSTNVTALQKELDSQRSKCRHMERQLQRQDADQEEKVTRLKLSYEEKMRGLMPAAVRQELEDIISSLKSQVNSLQQRAAVLQDELDLKIKHPLGSFGTLTSSPIIKSSV